jgi:hypothetical protein
MMSQQSDSDRKSGDLPKHIYSPKRAAPVIIATFDGIWSKLAAGFARSLDIPSSFPGMRT